MVMDKNLPLIVFNFPEYSDLCRNTFDILNKVIHARVLQQNENIPFIEDAESIEIDSDLHEDGSEVQSTSNITREFCRTNETPTSLILSRVQTELLDKSALAKRLARLEKDGKPFAIVVPKGDVELKILDKHLGKVLQVKDKQIFQIIFLGPKISPLMDRNEPLNTKTALKFLNLTKCHALDEEKCLQEFIKHLRQFI